MLIGASEGDRFRFEIVLMSDGFIVRVRSNESGEVFGSRDRLFRTASAAFAFAEKSALKDAEDCLKGSEDKAEIEAKTEALMTASQKLGEKVYEQAQAAQAAQGAAAGADAQGGAGAQAGAGAKAADENVVDAEFKEVKDTK